MSGDTSTVSKDVIYVAGYPRSGTTWLARLLGDVLNCPTGGATPAHKAKMAEGLDRPEPFIIRKGHFRAINDGPLGTFTMPLSIVRDNRVVVIVRDPRDVAVSRLFYFNRPLETVLVNMTSDTGWNEFITSWLDCGLEFSFIKYEDLVANSCKAVTSLLEYLQLPIDSRRVQRAVHRQSFAQRTKWTEETLTGPIRISHLKFLRKGIVGDWRNHFKPEQEHFIWDALGETMELLGYER